MLLGICTIWANLAGEVALLEYPGINRVNRHLEDKSCWADRARGKEFKQMTFGKKLYNTLDVGRKYLETELDRMIISRSVVANIASKINRTC